MTKHQKNLLVSIAVRSYSTNAWFTIEEWLHAREMLHSNPEFRAYYDAKTRSGK